MAWVDDGSSAHDNPWVPFTMWSPEVPWGPCFAPTGLTPNSTANASSASSSGRPPVPLVPFNTPQSINGQRVFRPSSDRALHGRPHLVERNTFIEMEPPLADTVEGHRRERESISDPTSSRSSSRANSISSSSSSSSSSNSGSNGLMGGVRGEDCKGRQIEALDSLYFDTPFPSKLVRGGSTMPTDIPMHQAVPKPVHMTKHDQGTCTPCPFLLSDLGCLKGAECSLCHMPHNPGRDRQKPCKWKRQKFKDILDEQKNMIEADPFAFEITKMEIPSFILEDDRVYTKLVCELCRVWADARAKAADSNPADEQETVASRLVLLPRPKKVIKVAL
mmetsp:Transcript_129358/g.335409  ORF Transcript_129358/g.335409 Transcript_129358/m.335409 type:complete len:333 (-) Transcript_129358:72-1070(-)